MEAERALFLGGPRDGKDMVVRASQCVRVPYEHSHTTTEEWPDFRIVDYKRMRYVYPHGSTNDGPLEVVVYQAEGDYQDYLDSIGCILGELPLEFRGRSGFWISVKLMNAWLKFHAELFL